MVTELADGWVAELAVQLYVAADGHDQNPGTREKPFATLHQAKMKVRELKSAAGSPIHVLVRGGAYHLSEPLLLEAADSGTAECPIIYRAYPGETVIISGGTRLQPDWRPDRDGIWVAQLSEDEMRAADFNQLFINGVRQIRARYPNVTPGKPFDPGNGYVLAAGGTDRRPDQELQFDPATFTRKRWGNPSSGIVHAYQSHYWGNMQYRIVGVDWDLHTLSLGEGGFQLQRMYGINHKSRFYVENIFEELDAPMEWFLDREKALLYYYPPADLDLPNASVVAARLKQLIEFRGTPAEPVANIALEGFTFTHTQTTFMENYEDMGLGDWSIHRGGAVYMEGATDCAIKDCLFDAVGGNGVFLSRYNRRNTVTGCTFEGLGESAVCLVGSPDAVRMYRTWKSAELETALEEDAEIGPNNDHYPESCRIDNNLIHDIGVYGKQTAGVFISMCSSKAMARMKVPIRMKLCPLK